MKDLDSYINTLYENQNIGADQEQKNLYSKENYLKLLREVLEVLKENRDASQEELREKLYERSNLEALLRDFFLNRKMAPGGVISYGTNNFQETITIGNKEEVVLQNGLFIPKERKMEEDTIFDLASVTKLFTSLSILKLVQSEEINLNDEVVKYAPQFSNLKGITIFDLLTFEPLMTNGRIDSANSREEAEQILFTARKKELDYGKNKYNDIAPMVLKYVIEKVTGLTYQEYVQKEILDVLKMDSTFVNVPHNKLDRVASGNYDGRFDQNGNFIIRTNANLGVSTDDKARILGQPEGILSGHAGLFSTSKDLTTLARAIIDNKILNLNVRDMMVKNRTGFRFLTPKNDVAYRQYFGMLVYSKNPDENSTEVRHSLSGKSFASAGWSGTQQTIDPINQINFTLLSNRSHNRIVVSNKSKNDHIIYDNGMKTIRVPDGHEMIDASRYAWDRDDVIKLCIDLALKYKMLEDITGYNKNFNNVEEKHRNIM